MPAVSPDPLAHLEGALVSDYLDHWARLMPDAYALTFTDYLVSREGVVTQLTWAELDLWSRALAAAISARADRGDRVAIVCPQSVEYVVAFMAALRAGVICVPLFAPDMPGHGERLHGVLADCKPACLLTVDAKVELVAELAGDRDAILSIDALQGDARAQLAAGFTPPAGITHDDIAYLQYTSGSTRAPAGVELTHGNLVGNSRQIIEGYLLQYGETSAVSWLPLFHDMGLLIGAPGTIVCGAHTRLMDPLAFLMKPQRWARAMHGLTNVITAAPNFAYGYLTKKVKESERDELDLSGVIALLNGAEPVLPATVETFLEFFAPAGIRPEASYPSFGLAEATVFVTRSRTNEAPLIRTIDPVALQQGLLQDAPAGSDSTMRIVSCGIPVDNQFVAIVDEQGRRLPEGHVGEIWVCGPNVGQGYWQRPEESAATFGAVLSDPGDLPSGPWLRTGDLGALVEEDLYVTGRQKDLIIIDGRNVYPHDVEHSVERAHPAIAAHRLAAFAVSGADGEQLVVVAERHRSAEDAPGQLDAIIAAARAAVSQEHSVALTDFVLIEPHTISRTSSGKIARHGARSAYLTGELARVGLTGEAG